MELDPNQRFGEDIVLGEGVISHNDFVDAEEEEGKKRDYYPHRLLPSIWKAKVAKIVLGGANMAVPPKLFAPHLKFKCSLHCNQMSRILIQS